MDLNDIRTDLAPTGVLRASIDLATLCSRARHEGVFAAPAESPPTGADEVDRPGPRPADHPGLSELGL